MFPFIRGAMVTVFLHSNRHLRHLVVNWFQRAEAVKAVWEPHPPLYYHWSRMRLSIICLHMPSVCLLLGRRGHLFCTHSHSLAMGRPLLLCPKLGVHHLLASKLCFSIFSSSLWWSLCPKPAAHPHFLKSQSFHLLSGSEQCAETKGLFHSHHSTLVATGWGRTWSLGLQPLKEQVLPLLCSDERATHASGQLVVICNWKLSLNCHYHAFHSQDVGLDTLLRMKRGG